MGCLGGCLGGSGSARAEAAERRAPGDPAGPGPFLGAIEGP